MAFMDQITSLHLDFLKEIGNIGAGHAATALSQLLNKRINMTVPNVEIVSFDEMSELAGGAENVVACVFLRTEGDLPGSMFFILPLDHAAHLIREMTGDPNFSLAMPPYNEFALSALQELGNILCGSYLTALADFTGLSLHPSVPAVGIDMVGAIISFGLLEQSQVSDHVIVIDTALNDVDTPVVKSLRGHFFLLPDPDSFQTLFTILGVNGNAG
jgi:chemotaxis protein CheC